MMQKPQYNYTNIGTASLFRNIHVVQKPESILIILFDIDWDNFYRKQLFIDNVVR